MVSSQVTSRGLCLFLAEWFVSICHVLVVSSLFVVRETSQILVGASSCHCGQSLLSRFSKGFGSSSLVALGSDVSQSLWYVGESSPDAECSLLSYLWRAALI